MSRSAIHRTLAVALVGCAAAAALAACNSPGAVGQTSLGGPSSAPAASAPAASAPPHSPPASSPGTPTATVTVTATHTAKPPVSHAGYDAARKEWQQGATAISAQMGLYWDNAATDLTSGETSDSGDTSGYAAAIKELKQLITLPDAQQTPTQNAEYHADINALNTFFNTPGLYS